MASKLEGLAAYNTYERDNESGGQAWQQLRPPDEQAVRQLLQQLEQMAQQGRLPSGAGCRRGNTRRWGTWGRLHLCQS